MGVPRLSIYIFKHFPEAVAHFAQGEKRFRVDHLYIDGNAILHVCAQKAYNYGQHKRMMYPYKDFSEKEKMKKTFSLFFDAIIQLMNIVTPQKSLYIAIDGPAPIAKQAQQRQRRFITTSSQESTFDSNSLTPGTLFMFELTKYINYRIRHEMTYSELFKKIIVYFDPPNRPGEGEHKCVDHIRALPKDQQENESHCIFGPDGDLLMLTLAVHLPKMLLFREDQYNVGEYDLIDMGIVRNKLPQMMGFEKQYWNLRDDAINDFILIGFFVGNDFLPKVPMFYMLEDGLQLMLGVYAHSSHGRRLYSLTVEGQPSLIGFSKFIEYVSKYEQKYLTDQSLVQLKDPMFKDETLLKNIKSRLTAQGKLLNVLDYQGFRRDYYKKSNIDITNQVFNSQLETMCHDYIKSFMWVYYYYIYGLPSWDWHYKWHYAPLMTDLFFYLKNFPSEYEDLLTFNKGEPLRPFAQLVSVLPPSSIQLVPPPLRKLIQGPMKAKGYYPEKFHIDYEGKTKEHMGVVILPFVDTNYVRQIYDTVPLKGKYARNSMGSIYCFKTNIDSNVKYISDYGTINSTNVVRKISLI